ncbi:hypothetical protein LTR36_004971 [Oleoguttula mirabilis]|uniref:Thioesterase domain-containing protein n=1 Tax=Oleoguttula mirabilis TaxID=1507867 RepID=A0AAV9JYE9_9PEZI|nr:hypothetical protein LTR36_004971 [Oleoguttula mirabilis]
MSEPKHRHLPEDVARYFESMSPQDRIKAVLDVRAPTDQRFVSPWVEQQCKLREVKSLSSTHSLVTFAFTVSRFYCNGSGNLHGGAQATIFDMATSIAMQAISKQEQWINGGVSRVLTVTYLRPAPEGEELLLECDVVHMGKRLAMLKGTLKRERDGAIISTCDHNKAAVDAKPGWKL